LPQARSRAIGPAPSCKICRTARPLMSRQSAGNEKGERGVPTHQRGHHSALGPNSARLTPCRAERDPRDPRGRVPQERRLLAAAFGSVPKSACSNIKWSPFLTVTCEKNWIHGPARLHAHAGETHGVTARSRRPPDSSGRQRCTITFQTRALVSCVYIQNMGVRQRSDAAKPAAPACTCSEPRKTWDSRLGTYNLERLRT